MPWWDELRLAWVDDAGILSTYEQAALTGRPFLASWHKEPQMDMKVLKPGWTCSRCGHPFHDLAGSARSPTGEAECIPCNSGCVAWAASHGINFWGLSLDHRVEVIDLHSSHRAAELITKLHGEHPEKPPWHRRYQRRVWREWVACLKRAEAANVAMAELALELELNLDRSGLIDRRTRKLVFESDQADGE